MDRFNKFIRAVGTDRREAFEFRSGTARSEEIRFETEADGELIAPKELEIGKPLSVLIRNIYPGKFGDKDLLATSCVKGIGAFDAAPEAVNLLRKDAKKRTDIRVFDADEQGTPVVYYSKALTKTDTVATVKLDLNDFPDEAFKTVGEGLKRLGGVPLFVAAQPWLVIGSLVVPIIGSLLRSIFEKRHFFKLTHPMFFTFPGGQPVKEGFVLLMEDDHFEETKDHFMVDNRGLYVSRDERRSPYRGDYPYVVLVLDGHDRDEQLGDFEQTAASAALMEKFRPDTESSFPMDAIVDLVKASSDFTFRRRADRLDTKLRGLPESDEFKEERERLKKERDANMANVKSEELKRAY